jgi:hypothetical protein
MMRLRLRGRRARALQRALTAKARLDDWPRATLERLALQNVDVQTPEVRG